MTQKTQWRLCDNGRQDREKQQMRVETIQKEKQNMAAFEGQQLRGLINQMGVAEAGLVLLQPVSGASVFQHRAWACAFVYQGG